MLPPFISLSYMAFTFHKWRQSRLELGAKSFGHQSLAVGFTALSSPRYMIHFHPLRVKKVQKETEDCVSISFEVPAELENIFRFSQGQSLTVKKQLNNEEVRRTYSICSAPSDNLLRVAVKKVEGGTFSTWANESLK